MSDNIERALGRVEGKLDALIAVMQSLADDHKKLDERVDGLEKDQHTGKVFLSVLAGLAGFIASNITSILGWFKS